MNTSLFLVCPTDCLETVINREYEGVNYFYTSLGNTSPNDLKTMETIKDLIKRHNITKIYFVLSEDNTVILNSVEAQSFSKIRGLQGHKKIMNLREKKSEILWKSNDSALSTLSYYLNQKILQLKANLNPNLFENVEIKGKVYVRSKNTLIDIFPDLFWLKKFNLN